MPSRPLDYLYEKLLSRVGLVLLALALIVNVGALLAMGAAAEKLEDAGGGDPRRSSIVESLGSQQQQPREPGFQKWSDELRTMRYGFAAVLLSNTLMILAGVLIFVRGLSQKRGAAVLATEVELRAVELRALTVHLQSTQEEERRTIARELHDELGGTLSAVKMDIMMGRDAAAKCNDDKSVTRLQRAHGAIDSAIKFSRRLIENLRPTLLDNLGFEAALRSMTEQFCERSTCRCVISLPAGELHMTSAQSTALYRICQEALANVMKYAEAKQVTLTLKNDASQWTLIVADDGVGLDATKQHRTMCHGLIGMRERVVALGGSFDIRGKAGQGTTLTASFPVDKGNIGKDAGPDL